MTLRRPDLAMAVTRLLLAALLLFGVGCIEFSQILRIEPGGNGQLIQTFRMGEAFVELIQQEAGELSPEELEQGLAQMKEQFRTNEAELGEGVRFVDVETIPAAEGSPLPFSGFTFTYDFDDVTRLDLSALPSMGDGMGARAGAMAADDEERLKFRFAKKGKGSVLSVVFFDSEEQMAAALASASEETEQEGAEGLEELADGMLDMFKEMLAGFRISVGVEVVGQLVATNAPQVDGSTVTLIELDFDRLLEQEDKLKSLAGGQGEPSLAQLGLLMQEVDGVTFPTTPEVTIEFQ